MKMSVRAATYLSALARSAILNRSLNGGSAMPKEAKDLRIPTTPEKLAKAVLRGSGTVKQKPPKQQ